MTRRKESANVMAGLTFNHSEDWIEKLLAIQELLPSERQVLLEHVALCATCNCILNEYYALAEQVKRLTYKPTPDLPKGLPPRLLQLWQDISKQEIERCNSVTEPAWGIKY